MGVKDILDLHRAVGKLVNNTNAPALAIVAVLETEKQKVLCEAMKLHSMGKMAKAFADQEKVLNEEIAKAGVT